jgi:hypothetical protein
MSREQRQAWVYPIKKALTFLSLTMLLWFPALLLIPFMLDDPRSNTPWTFRLTLNIVWYPAYVIIGAALAFLLRHRQLRHGALIVWSPVLLFLTINVGLVIFAARFSANDGLSAEELVFFRACSTGDVDAVTRGLEDGVDPNQRNRLGNTPVSIAVAQEQQEVLRILLRNGADANLAHEGNGALTFVGDPDMLELLLSHGLDPNRGAALHIAVRRGYTSAVELLVAHGADPSRVNRDGEDALSLAIALERWDPAIVIAQTCPTTILERASKTLASGQKTDHPGRSMLERTIAACIAAVQEEHRRPR